MGEFGFWQSVWKLAENYENVLFSETNFEESNINQKRLIWSKYKIITKFGQNNEWVWFMVNCTKKLRKVLFYETYFEVGSINRKPLIWSHYRLIMKFGQKNWVSLVLGKVFKNCQKIKEKFYFTKLTSKRVTSTVNYLFCPNIRL